MHTYDDFDMLFLGHIHKQGNVARHNGVNGIYEHTAKASLSKKEQLGCSFIENDDIQDNRFLVSELTYVEGECHVGSPIVITIPIGENKEERIQLRKKVYDKISIEIENANSLMLLGAEDTHLDFLSSYNPPYIKSSREDSMNANLAETVSLNEIFELQNNLIVFGKDKCGKTSLLKRVQLEYLMSYSTYNRIPIYLDSKEEEARIERMNGEFQIENIVRSYLGINRSLTCEIFNSNQLVLLIDNFKVNSAFANYLVEFLTGHPNIHFLITTDDVISNNMEMENLEMGEDVTWRCLYFYDLRRQEIIKYTDKQLSSIRDKNTIQERILKLCKQMELPYTYWTVSLFLLIHHKSSDTYNKNLFSILDVCVDEIFGKKRLLIKDVRAKFEQLKGVCASLAAYLFEEHEATVYSATQDEIDAFLNSECERNVRIVLTPQQIFNFFVQCGMLKRRWDGRYVFRLNGFFEYFLAYQMTKSQEFREKILSDDKKYLGFKNQLEIYSGLRHDDTDLLSLVFAKTREKCEPIFSKYDVKKDNELLTKIGIPDKVEQQCRELSVRAAMSSVQKAELEDILEQGSTDLKSEVHLMTQYDPNQNDSEIIGRYLSILARVYKNIDEIDDAKMDGSEVFRALVDYYCSYSFYIIDEFSAKMAEDIDSENVSQVRDSAELDLLRFVSNFSPLIAQVELFEGLGHYTFIRMIEREIQRLKLDADNNQYKLFVLYFLLLDISLDNAEEVIDEAIATIVRIPLLRYMMLLKLNYYLAFRTDGNKSLQSILSDRIKQLRLLLDNKTDLDSIHKGIHNRKKNALIHRNMRK